MPVRQTDHATRVAIIERHLAGEPLRSIADDVQLNFYTARKWWRAYRRHGWAALRPQRPAPPQRSSALATFDPLVKYVALRLKREHPAWGLDVLVLALRRRPSLTGKRVPKRTALWNCLRQFSPRLHHQRRLRVRRPRQQVTTVTAVHERWQMDFKGAVRIPALGRISPFVVCDELTGAPLAGIVHQVTRGTQRGTLTARQVQADLRAVFCDWGLPDQLRMDRDPLWVGSTRLEWPGTVLLWLVGLGVTPVINRPARPTDNAIVERRHRIWNEHVYIGATYQTVEAVQAATDQAWRDRREVLPSRNPQCGGQPPLQAHPELAQPRRPFAPDCESALFDIRRVYAYLSQWEWHRKVSPTGTISVADQDYRVGAAYAEQIVKVRFDAATAEFIAQTIDGNLRRFTVPVISADFILGLAPGGT